MEKFGALNMEIDESKEQVKFGFLIAAVTALEPTSKNHIWLNSDRNCLILMLKLKPQLCSFWKN